MGVTVHFKGRLLGTSAFDEVIRLGRDLASELKSTATIIDNPKATLLRVHDNEQPWDYVGAVKGIEVQLHPNADPLRLEFDEDLYIQEYVKTQFAGVDVHVRLAGFLHDIAPFFVELIVDDEGEYYETGDVGRLRELLDWCSRAIEKEITEDPTLYGPIRGPDGRVIDLMKR